MWTAICNMAARPPSRGSMQTQLPYITTRPTTQRRRRLRRNGVRRRWPGTRRRVHLALAVRTPSCTQPSIPRRCNFIQQRWRTPSSRRRAPPLSLLYESPASLAGRWAPVVLTLRLLTWLGRTQRMGERARCAHGASSLRPMGGRANCCRSWPPMCTPRVRRASKIPTACTLS